MELFFHDNKPYTWKNIPPTADALLHHTMQGEQPIRLVSGLQVKMHGKEVLHQIPEVGLGMNATRNGYLDETCTANSQGAGLMNIILSLQWIGHYHSFM